MTIMAVMGSFMTCHVVTIIVYVAQLYEFDDFDRERLFRLFNRIGDIGNSIRDISK